MRYSVGNLQGVSSLWRQGNASCGEANDGTNVAALIVAVVVMATAQSAIAPEPFKFPIPADVTPND
jgi:hypothetical protein